MELENTNIFRNFFTYNGPKVSGTGPLSDSFVDLYAYELVG